MAIRVRALLVLLALAAIASSDAQAVIRFETRFLMQDARTSNLDAEAPYFSTGDLNADGVLDIVSFDGQPSLVIHLGRGDGSFQAPVFVPAPIFFGHSAIADFDGDGSPDVGGVTSGTTAVMFGGGTITNWTPAVLATQTPAYGNAAVSADFDLDGRPDLVTLFAYPGVVKTFLSRPGRTFAAISESHPAIAGGYHVARVADISQDGIPDIVVGIRQGNYGVVILEGLGDGHFVAKPIPEFYAGVYGLDLADASGDGLPDIVVGRGFTLEFLRNMGDGNFARETLPNYDFLQHFDCRFADVTEDGIVDIVASRHTGLATRPGLGGGSFGVQILTPMTGWTYPAMVLDADSDEHLDVVGLFKEGGIVTGLGDGSGRFGGSVVEPAGLTGGNIHSADLDSDGDADIVYVAQNGSIQVVRSDPGRTFAVLPPVGTNYNYYQPIGIADFDEDGHVDLAVSRGSMKLDLFHGDGGGGLVRYDSLTVPGVSSAALVAGEVTGDSHADLVIAMGQTVAVFAGRGDGSFEAPVTTPVGGAVRDLAIGHLDADLLPDLALVVSLPEPPYGPLTRWRRALGIGSSTFTVQTMEPSGEEVAEVEIADLNGDARDDVIITTPDYTHSYIMQEPSLHARLQLPDGSLSAAISSPWPNLAVDTRVLDADRNGHVDLICRVNGGRAVFLGDGAGGFALEGGFLAGSSYVMNCVVGDFDADGFSDVMQTIDDLAFGYRVVVHHGRRDLAAPAVQLGELPAVFHVGESITIDWDATDDYSVSTVDLFVSRRGQTGPFERIATGLSNIGEHTWTVAGPLSDSVVFKAVVRDSSGNVGKARSTGPRAISASVTAAASSPPAFELSSISPNPGHSRFSVAFSLPAAAHTRIALYDMSGREVACLLEDVQAAGRHVFEWRRDVRALRSGLYFLELRAGGRRATARITLLR